MQKKKFPVEQTSEQEQLVTVLENHNTLIVYLRDQTWVSIYTKNKEMLREHSPDPILGFTVSPGIYTIHTDGKIESVCNGQ